MKLQHVGMTLIGLFSAVPVTAQVSDGSLQAHSLEEVVVTARKREERLRDIPIAASAITEAMRESLVLDNLDDYLRQTPSTTLVTSGPEYLNDITIRGQGSGRLGFSETATGLFRDGMYSAGGGFGGRSLTRMDTLDVSRIEVLRGPQGALFGRNSVGGAINVVTNRPRQELAISATARAWNTDRRDGEFVFNVPLGDDLALRIAGLIHDQNEGFIRNETTGHDVDTQRYRGARAAFEYAPTDSLRFGAMYEYYDSAAPAFGTLGQRATRVDGTTLDPDRYRRADLDREGGSDITQHYALLTADYRFAAADLALKVSRAERDGSRSNEDFDHFAGHSGIDVAPGAAVLTPDYTLTQAEDYDRTTAQLYLASTGASAFSWLAGIEGLWSQSAVSLDPNLCPAYTGSPLPETAGCIVGRAGVLPAQSASVRTTGRLTLNHDQFSEQVDSYSAFGSVDWRLTERLKVGLELRVQRDEKDFVFQRYSGDPLVFFGAGAPPAGMLAPIPIDPDGAAGPRAPSPVQYCPPTLGAQCAPGREAASLSSQREWTFWTPAATLHYAVTPAQAFYLRFATGYRPGGFNTNQSPATVRADLEAGVLYEPEEADSFEVGWKGELFGGFLEGEAALFYVRTMDVQVVSAPSAQARGFILQNAGDTFVYGGELEFRNVARLGAGQLVTSFGISTQAGEFDDGASALLDVDGDGVPNQLDLSGRDVPRLRDYQATLNIAYNVPLSSALTGMLGLSFQTAEGGAENPDNSRDYSGYELLDARLGVRGEHWRVALVGRNLTDQRYLLNTVGGNDFWSEPRTYGVEIRMSY
jgi:outer membrane receptor protein involved in Fe transport